MFLRFLFIYLFSDHVASQIFHQQREMCQINNQLEIEKSAVRLVLPFRGPSRLSEKAEVFCLPTHRQTTLLLRAGIIDESRCYNTVVKSCSFRTVAGDYNKWNLSSPPTVTLVLSTLPQPTRNGFCVYALEGSVTTSFIKVFSIA